MSTKTYQQGLLVALAACVIVSLIDPPYPDEQLLQHAPTAVAIPLLLVVARRSWLTNVSMTCIALLLLLHAVGARYIYTFVPFGDALRWLSLGDSAGARNHYDRLVHLMFGALVMCPCVDALVRHGKLRWRWASAFALALVGAASGAYEVFEWILTVVADPTRADLYNGQQGDVWDAQKDMALAFLGALAALPIVAAQARRRALSPTF